MIEETLIGLDRWFGMDIDNDIIDANRKFKFQIIGKKMTGKKNQAKEET